MHLDELSAEAAVSAAAAGRSSQPTSASTRAQDAVDDAEGFELSWYATQELDEVLTRLRIGP